MLPILLAAEGGPDIPLSMVVSTIAGIVSFMSGIILFLAKSSFETEKKILRDQNSASQSLADRALVECAKLNERIHGLEKEVLELKGSIALTNLGTSQAAREVERMRDTMVTRETFLDQTKNQNRVLDAISSAVRSKVSTSSMQAMRPDTRVDPPSDPPVTTAPRPRPQIRRDGAE